MATKLYICAIMRNEHKYIREWVEHHINIGVSHFYLYDNESTKGYADEIGDYLANGTVEIKYWPDSINTDRASRSNKQISAYNNFISSRKWGDNEWCAFIDLDEFINPSIDLLSFLGNQSANVSAIGIAWRLFNANSHIEQQDNLRNSYTQEVVNTDLPKYLCEGKTIARLSQFNRMLTCHYGEVTNKYVKTNGLRLRWIASCFIFIPSVTNIVLDHYLTKSWEDWVFRLKRGSVTQNASALRTVDAFFKYNPELLPYKDELVKKYLGDEE